MKNYLKFGLLIVAIVGALAWLAVGGISETKTYYKTIAELNQMGEQAHGQKDSRRRRYRAELDCARRARSAVRAGAGQSEAAGGV